MDRGSSIRSCIGQADDSVLLANDIHSFNNLLLLTLEYCKEYSVTLVPDKTKLIAFCPPGSGAPYPHLGRRDAVMA